MCEVAQGCEKMTSRGFQELGRECTPKLTSLEKLSTGKIGNFAEMLPTWG